MAVFSPAYASSLSPCQDGNVHTHATTKEMKTMEFRINSRHTKQAIGVQVTFITEKKFQKQSFVFSVTFAFILNLYQDGNVHMYATTKELKKISFKVNSRNIKQTFGKQVAIIFEIKPQKERFLAKYDCFFRNLCIHFEPL